VGLETTAIQYGNASLELLAGQVAALKDSDPLDPVTVVVASNYTAVATRRAPEPVNLNEASLRGIY